ncbi:MAG: EAL domain-containing protein [Sideroxydans sp.]|nr:EAL domain-containing protein [Sideroxydans sp.]
MQPRDILPVLYDLSVTIGSEIKLHALLQRTLQRLLYHTSYSAGFVCLDIPVCEQSQGMIGLKIEAAVGDFDLVSMTDKVVEMPREVICGGPSQSAERALSAPLLGVNTPYRSFLRLPLEGNSLLVLLAIERPDTQLELPLILKPILAQLSRAILLCKNNDALIAASEAKQKQIQHSLHQLESEFRSLVELSPIGVGFSSDGLILDANTVWLEMFGYANIGELQGRDLLEAIAPSSRADVGERMQRRMQGGQVASTYETRGLRKDGSEFPLLVSARRIETDAGARTLAFFIDLTEQKKNEQMLHDANEMLRLVLETAPMRIFWKDRQLRYLGCNAIFAHDAGKRTPEELIGRDDFSMGWREQAELYREDDNKVMDSGKSRLNFDEPQTAPDGRTIWLRTSKVPLRNDSHEVIGVLGMYEDITDRKEAESQIHQLAFYDTLTGLPNRRLMHDRLRQALASSTRNKRYGALCMLDLDDFKVINDSRGHATGDELLQEVARRLQTGVRDGDTVARLGGDEFVVILESLSDKTAEAATLAENIAEKLRAMLHEPFELTGFTTRISSSIGIVTFLDHEVEVDDLLKYTDTAMYQAKAAGRDAIRFYDPALQAELEHRQKLGEELMHAVDNKELRLYLQCQVDSTGRVIGAEALVRWQHPEKGLVPPLQFIPLAEENGLIVPIGKWVLDTACAYLKTWQAHHATRELVLSINVSARQFRQPDFVSSVQRALQSNGVKAAHLKLELTESTVLVNVQDTIAKMSELKLLGVSFSMDDFGTGYSSLQYLKQLPLDQLKIDQSFVRDIVNDPNDAAIVQTIIAMTEVLGLEVIAEGVETEEQREFLDLRGCHHFQGYLFGRPQPREEFEAALKGQTS